MKKLPIIAFLFSLFTFGNTILLALEIEEEEWEEIQEIGEHLHEELLGLNENKAELGEVIGELKLELSEAEEEDRHEIEVELSRLKVETKIQDQLIRLHENLLSEHKKVLKAREGNDEDAFWETLEHFHRTNDGFHLRTELVYLNQDKQLLSLELKFLKSIGENNEAQRVESELHLAELNQVSHIKLLEKWEELEVIWKKDPFADTEEAEEEFWILNEKQEFQRIQNELKHSQKTLALELEELQRAQAKLESKAKSIQQLQQELNKSKALFEKLTKARHSEDDELIEELEERYHLLRESIHLKREIQSLQEHFQHLIAEGEIEEAEEVQEEIQELREELKELQQ